MGPQSDHNDANPHPGNTNSLPGQRQFHQFLTLRSPLSPRFSSLRAFSSSSWAAVLALARCHHDGKILPLVLISMLPPASSAEHTSLLNINSLPRKQVYGVAYMTPLAVSNAGTPVVALLDLRAGDVVPPHATASGLRLLTVLQGNLSWGDGRTVDQARETVYPAGSILTLPAGVYHWAAARSEDVRIQLVVLDEATTLAVQEQMQ